MAHQQVSSDIHVSSSQASTRDDSDATKVTYKPLSREEGAHLTDTSKSKAHWWQRLLLDTWFPELLGLAVSAACLVAILSLVLYFNGKPSPQLPCGVTLNAFVSVLATASRSSLIYVVTTALGQLKWCWDHTKDKRTLKDIQDFDSASRGPWGSVTPLTFGRW